MHMTLLNGPTTKSLGHQIRIYHIDIEGIGYAIVRVSYASNKANC